MGPGQGSWVRNGNTPSISARPGAVILCTDEGWILAPVSSANRLFRCQAGGVIYMIRFPLTSRQGTFRQLHRNFTAEVL